MKQPFQRNALRLNAVDHVAEHLRRGIVAGRYAPGHRLIEADIGAEFGVSRGPVREAFRKLSAEGMVEVTPHRGAEVRRLRYRDAVELFQLREALDTLAVRQAAATLKLPPMRRRFEEEIAPIWTHGPRSDLAAYTAENNLFHQAVLDASGNDQLAKLSRQLQFPLILLRGLRVGDGISLSDLDASVDEHRMIATMLLNGEADEAEAAMRSHIRLAQRRLDALPRSLFRPAD